MERQRAVVHRSQLLALGVSRSRIRWQVERGTWQPVGPTVLALQTGALDEEQRRWAAVLLGGRRSALSGRTALEALGLQGWRDERLHLLVPHGRTPPQVPRLEVAVHETRRDVGAELHRGRVIPMLRVEPAAVDAVEWTQRARTACGLIAAVVQQRLATAERLLAVVERRPCLRNRALVRSALQDIVGGAQALSEIDFGLLCRRHHLPVPQRQAIRLDPQGRKRYVDAALVGPDGRVVLVEVDGALHLLARTYWTDMERINEMTMAGERVLRFPTVLVRTEPEKVADQLRRALGLGGVRGRGGDR